MSDHSADDVSKRDEMDRDPDAVSDQDLDQAAGGIPPWLVKGDWYVEDEAGGDAAADATTKNDNPESDR